MWIITINGWWANKLKQCIMTKAYNDNSQSEKYQNTKIKRTISNVIPTIVVATIIMTKAITLIKTTTKIVMIIITATIIIII